MKIVSIRLRTTCRFPVVDLSDEIQPLPTERPAPLLPFLPGDTMEYSGVFPPFPRTVPNSSVAFRRNNLDNPEE